MRKVDELNNMHARNCLCLLKKQYMTFALFCTTGQRLP